MEYDYLIKKINDGNNNFTKEDYFYISENIELKKLFVYSISKKNTMINSSIMEYIDNQLAIEIDHLNLDKNIVSNFWLNIFFYMVDNGYYSEEYFNYFNTLNLDQDCYAKMRDYLEKSLDDKNNIFKNIRPNFNIINKLLDHKRYDIIELLDPSNSNICIDEFNYNRIIREWPYDKKPKIIIKYEKDNSISSYSTKDSFNDLISCYYSNEEKKKEILNIILDKIKGLSGTSDFSELNDLKYVKDILKENKVDILEYAKILYDNNCLSFANYLVNNKIITIDELNKKIEFCFNNNFYVPNIVIDFNVEFQRSDAFINYLINRGEIKKLLINFNILKNYNVDLSKYYAKIVDQINNNNITDSDFLEEISYNLKDCPEIFTAIVNKGKIYGIEMKCLNKSDETIDNIIKVFHYNDNTYFFNDIPYDKFTEKLIKRLFDEKMYSVIVKHFLFHEFIDNNFDYMLDKLNNNYFANLVVINCYHSIKNYQELVLKLIDNPSTSEKIIDKLFNDDYSVYSNSSVIYDKILNYLCNKYSLNRNHIDILKERFGNELIKYLNNKNMIKIINLSDEKFNKIIDLFPDVQFTMTDLEASYESIIQYLYGKKNPSDITIFPNFVHAMENKDTELIKQLKEKIIVYVKEDTFKYVIQKYDLQNIHSIDELLNIIVEKYSTEEKDRYLNILHELTNEFINISRENFHNNHYFEEINVNFYQFFEKVLENIDNDNFTNIMKMASRLDKKFYKEFGKNKNITSELEIPENLLKYVIFKVKDEKTRNRYLPVLKEIVDYYYQSKKSEYLNLISLGVELKLPYIVEEKSKQNEIIKYFIINSNSYEDSNGNLLIDVITNKLGMDSNIVLDCIKYYSGNKNCKTDIDVIKSNLPIIIKEMTFYIRNNDIYFHSQLVNKDNVSIQLDKDFKIKRNYYVDSCPNIYQILTNLNVELLENGLLTNEEMYQKLVEIMTKKKIHLLPENLMELLKECNISFDSTTVSSFINFFVPIYTAEKKRLETMGRDGKEALSTIVPILINGEIYNGVSDVYSQILGENDSKLLKANPSPNSATEKTDNIERLNEAIQFTLDNFRRTQITIPTFDRIVLTGSNSNKKLNAIVGNFTDPSNLTHGERTGSCMRIGGVGETLFDFCLHNENGFHIRFEDQDTHEYISRVSGFRNGNTVFLNELRYSCNLDRFLNIDLVNACKVVANLLIELTKDSTCPIENVVITNTYAMSYSGDKEINLGIDNNKEGLPLFYSDIGNQGIVLATSSKDKPFSPINFDKTNVPVYKTCRAKPIIITDMKESIAKVNRVASIKTLLEFGPKISYENLDQMIFDNGIICSVVSDDWYIYVDNNKEIYYDYINVDERAKMELKEYLEIIDELVNKVVEQKEMESDSYGL